MIVMTTDNSATVVPVKLHRPDQPSRSTLLPRILMSLGDCTSLLKSYRWIIIPLIVAISTSSSKLSCKRGQGCQKSKATRASNVRLQHNDAATQRNACEEAACESSTLAATQRNACETAACESSTTTAMQRNTCKRVACENRTTAAAAPFPSPPCLDTTKNMGGTW